MDCNKDEATRAKEIAVKKFGAKDIMGAKKFALKAQALFPGLDGIPQMLSTLDVYISADNKINGEADWYGILGVDQKADDETVRKQYRKLALMLHPDKNKSIGADGAFKLISEAWTLLSDKTKRIAYDQKRNLKTPQQKASKPSGRPAKTPEMNGQASKPSRTPSTTPEMNGQASKPSGRPSTTPEMNGHTSTKSTKSSTKPPKSTAPRAGHHSTPAPSHKPKPNTFWTVCHRCKMQYEYLRVYLNHNLLCPNCHEPFFAVETAPPSSNGSKSAAAWNFSQQRQNLSNQKANKNTFNSGRSSTASSNTGTGGLSGSDMHNRNNFQWCPFSRAGTSSAAQAATMVQQAYEKVKREREEAQAATKKEEAMRKKHQSSKKTSGSSSTANAAKRRRGIDDVSVGSNQMNGKAGEANSSISKHVNAETGRSTITRDFTQLDIQKALMEKAKKEIRKKLNEQSSASGTESATNEEGNRNGKENEGKEKSLRNKDAGHDQSNCRDSMETDLGEYSRRLPGVSGSNLEAEIVQAISINVPDPDFHDFDKDRMERSFGDNQVWAAYDDDDGMPRYYAMIHSVISSNPFKMRISWLNSKTNSELGPSSWVASGFSKTCGDFRVGRYEVNNSLNSFSHKVRWSKGSRGAIRIYPRKGEVWALYRNWSPDWNELTADEVRHKYDMVEVLEDYSEELGVTVTSLVKVAGFKTVFHRHLDPREVKRISREEMFRFSHQVPSHLLTGQEAPNAPKGCRELDPAATPLELLQVIADVKDEEIMEINDAVEGDNVVGDVKEANGKEMAEKSNEKCKEEKECAEDSKVNLEKVSDEYMAEKSNEVSKEKGFPKDAKVIIIEENSEELNRDGGADNLKKELVGLSS